MWRNDLQSTAGLRDAMQLRDESKNIGNVLDDVATNDLFKLIVAEWIWKGPEIVNDICMAQRIRIDAKRAGKFVLATADIENCFFRCRR